MVESRTDLTERESRDILDQFVGSAALLGEFSTAEEYRLLVDNTELSMAIRGILQHNALPYPTRPDKLVLRARESGWNLVANTELLHSEIYTGITRYHRVWGVGPRIRSMAVFPSANSSTAFACELSRKFSSQYWAGRNINPFFLETTGIIDKKMLVMGGEGIKLPELVDGQEPEIDAHSASSLNGFIRITSYLVNHLLEATK